MNRALELIHRLSTRRQIVLPLAFMTNLAVYVDTGSRTAVELNGASTAGGSYSTIKDWLSSQAGNIPECPDGIVGVTFDNNQ